MKIKSLDRGRIRLIPIVFVVWILVSGGIAQAHFTFGEPENLESALPAIDPARDFIDCVSYDGLEMYVDSLQPGGQLNLDICVLKRASKDSDWSPPENLGSAVNSTREDAAASISTDGLSLYFQSNRPGGYGRLDLYVTTRASVSDAWGPPVNLGPELNSDLNEAFPWIASDDLTLYFHAYNRADGYGRADIYISRRPRRDAPWEQAENLGPPVNTAQYNESGACPSPDGRLLFFGEDNTAPFRPEGFGGGDMWMTMRMSVSGLWETPMNLGPKVNGLSADFGPRISPDGRMLYFFTISNNTYDSWQSQIIPIVDFNGDGTVDTDDLVMMIENWNTSESLYDIGPFSWGDGVVDMKDLEVFMEYWEKENIIE
jgi:Tol biopolymer transport system component